MNFEYILNSTKNFKYINLVVTIVRIIIGFIFVFSAVTKILDVDYFAKIIGGYPFIPTELRYFLAYMITLTELICGTLLLINYQLQFAAFVLMMMTVLFTLVSFIRFALGDVSSCGCFGTVLDRKNDLSLIVENGIVILTLLWMQYVISQK